MSNRCAKISTPVIIIRLVGLSMRSQAVSTFDIGSRLPAAALRMVHLPIEWRCV